MSRKKSQEISRQEEILGILLITLGILVFMSLITYQAHEQPGNLTGGKIENSLGIAGVYISYFLIQYTIGYPSFVFPVMIILSGWTLFRGNDFGKAFRLISYLFVFAVYTSVILAIPEVTSEGGSDIGFSLSGLMGGVIAQYLFSFLGVAGSIVVLLSLIMITVIGATRFSVSEFLTDLVTGTSSAITHLRERWMEWREERARSRDGREKRSAFIREQNFDEVDEAGEAPPEAPRSEPRIQPIQREQMEIELAAANKQASAGDIDDTPPPKVDPGNYVFPNLDLLSSPPPSEHDVSKDELNANAQILEDRLQEFGVQGTVVEINPGPVITRYEVEPAPGVKISRIVALADDLALAMRAKRIRIVAPIPGKAAVGVEIPNRQSDVVYLKDVLNSVPFHDSESPLTLALGKTISGEPYVTRMDQMPHLLIAGSTGSGKSVCLNSIIASMLYKAHPTQLQFVMIDPKRLELSIYNNLRHHHLTYRDDLSEEVVTNASNAISVLRSMEAVMEHRYELLARAGVRNISDYNRKLQNGQLENMDVDEDEPFEPLPYLVLIVDELADLMMTAAREVEEPIARLTQMSRAVGIHLIVATQRPSVDVITGVIKANFPARIAFQVASKTDSRTILDLNGAEKLLGMGDMLFIPAGSPEPVRIHGAYVASEEIERIIAHVRKQPRYPKKILPVPRDEAATNADGVAIDGKRDALFNEAMKLVVRHQQGSISLIQRRLKVGYARAARIIDELEAAGVVGPFDGSKAREVLMDETELEDMGLS